MLTRAKAIELKQMPINSALQNQLVLSEILSYLPLKDLKTTRQVNQLWKDESRKYFKRRALFKIYFVTASICSKLEYLESSQCHDNLHILHHYNNRLESCVVKNAQTFQEKVEQFIQFHGAHIRFLKLNLLMDGSTNFKFLANVLKSVPKLKELELLIWFNNQNTFSKEKWMLDFNDFTIDPLVYLKKFMLRSTGHAINDEYIPKLRQLLRKLLQLTQNVETLDLQRDTCTKYDTFYLKEMKEMQMEWVESMGPMPFKNLSNIRIEGSRINKLLKLSESQHLIKLSIYSYYHDLKADVLQDLLKKRAKTLENFQIDYSIGAGEMNRLVMNFEFPSLPRLKSLKVNVSEPYLNFPSFPRMRLAVERGMLSFGLLESFMMGGERFTEKFPLLKSFTWKGRGFNPLIYERILPRPNQETDLCFPQFTSFDLSEPPTHNVYCNQEEYNEWMTWLAKLFPNVHNPQFNMARLSSQ